MFIAETELIELYKTMSAEHRLRNVGECCFIKSTTLITFTFACKWGHDLHIAAEIYASK